MKIVGISDTSNPSLYVDDQYIMTIIANAEIDSNCPNCIPNGGSTIQDYSINNDNFVLKEGRLPVNDYEAIVKIENKANMPLNKEINTKVNDKKLTVVGYYSSPYPYSQTVYVNTNTLETDIYLNKNNITIIPNDKEKVLEKYKEKGAYSGYDFSYNKFKEERDKENKIPLVTAIVILTISIIEMFFIIRTSYLSRIKEVGIYRAIGVKKKDIYTMFIGEIIAITTLSSVPVIVLVWFVFYKVCQI